MENPRTPIMSASSRLLTLALGLTAIGCGALAYQQYYLLKAARENVAGLEKERTELRDKLARLEKSRNERPRWSPTPSGGPVPTPNAEGANDSGGPVPTRTEGGFGRMRAMMESPQAQQFMAMQQKAALDSRYAALFRKLNLSPDMLNKFKDLLVERQTAVMDVMTAARNQGLDMRSSSQEISQLIRDAQAEVDNTIRDTLGSSAYQDYQDYEHTLPTRGTVGQLEQRLSYTSTPLNSNQVDQMARILADTNPNASNSNRGVGGGMFFGPDGASPAGPGGAFFGGGVTINDDAVARAQGVLSSSQMDALKQMQQEQQTRADLIQQLRNNRAASAAANSGGPVAVPTPSPSTGPGGG